MTSTVEIACPNCHHPLALTVTAPAATGERPAFRLAPDDGQAFRRFVDECCAVGVGCRVDSRELHEAYTAWCEKRRLVPLSGQRCGDLLDKHFGVGRGRSNGRRYYAGVTLRP